MRKIVPGVIMACLVVISIVACGTHHLAADKAKLACATQFSTWYYSQGGRTEIKTLSANFRPMLAAAKAHDKGQLKADSARVETADNTLQHHMPPNCVPNLNSNLQPALVAIDHAVVDANAKNVTATRTDTKTASSYLVKSSKALVSFANSK